MPWRPSRRFLLVIAVSAATWGFVEFGLPWLNETRRQMNYRQGVLSTTLKTCLDTTAANLTLGADKIDAFCNCVNQGIANSFTKDEWEYLRLRSSMLPSTIEKQATIVQKCLADARK